MVTQQPERHYLGGAGQRLPRRDGASPEAAIPWLARLRSEKLAAQVRASDVVLEYGAGLGWNLARLTCRRRLAFDLEDFLAPSIRAEGVQIIADIKALPGASVDAVICHHALEHVLQPATALLEMGRVCGRRANCCCLCRSSGNADTADLNRPSRIIISIPGTRRPWAIWSANPAFA